LICGELPDTRRDFEQARDFRTPIFIMRIRSWAVATGLMLGFGVAGVLAANSQQSLKAQAKIARPRAEKTALKKVPRGTVKSGELEKEHGHLVWSFDIAEPGSRNITEVQVDAITGKIVSVATETPAQQKAEARSAK
jgi:hypothetical protein